MARTLDVPFDRHDRGATGGAGAGEHGKRYTVLLLYYMLQRSREFLIHFRQMYSLKRLLGSIHVRNFHPKSRP